MRGARLLALIACLCGAAAHADEARPPRRPPTGDAPTAAATDAFDAFAARHEQDLARCREELMRRPRGRGTAKAAARDRTLRLPDAGRKGKKLQVTLRGRVAPRATDCLARGLQE